MNEPSRLEISAGTADDDATLVRHYLALWDSYGTPKDDYVTDAVRRVQMFIRKGRADHKLGAFIASVDGKAIGSLACQLHHSPYPEVIRPEVRKYGYVWSVFVEPEHRGRGAARGMMSKAITYLREIGCTAVVLHSSEVGEPLYRKLGFAMAKEMRLPLKHESD